MNLEAAATKVSAKLVVEHFPAKWETGSPQKMRPLRDSQSIFL
jgi:hypothetical protein